MPPPRANHRRRRALLAAAVLLPASASSPAASYDLSNQSVDLTQTAYTAADVLTLNATTLSAPAPFTLPAALHPTGTSTLGTPADLTLAGAIDGTRTLTKTGTAALVLAADNASFGGTITLTAGTLRLASPAALGPSTSLRVNVLPTAILDLNGYSAAPFSHNLIANGGVIVNDNPTSVSSISGQAISRGATTNFILGGAGDINLTAVGMVSSGSLTKIGTGTLTFNFGNSLYGGVIVNAGTVRLGPGASFSTPSLTVNTGAAFDLNGVNFPGVSPTLNGGALVNNNTSTPVTVGGFYTISTASPAIALGGAGDMTYSGIVSGSQSLTKVGAGTLTLVSATNSHIGGTTVKGGTLSIDYESSLGAANSPLTLDGGALRAANPTSPTAVGSLTLNRPLIISPAGGTLDARYTINLFTTLSGTGPLTKAGTGTLYFPSEQKYSFTGPLTISAGTVVLGSLSFLKSNTVILDTPSSPFSGYNNFLTFGALAGSGRIANVTYTVGGNHASTTFAGRLSAATLHKQGAGTLTLTGDSSGSDSPSTVYVHSGVVSLGDGSTPAAPSRVAVATDPNTTVLLNRPDSYTVTESLSGNGTLVKLGTGTATLTGTSALQITAVNVQQGTLRLLTPRTAVTTSLSVSVGGAALDVVTTPVVVDYASFASPPLDAVRQLLLTSRLTSSAADATHRLGYITSAQLPTSRWSTTTWFILDGTSLLVTLALAGDANLDGRLDPDDYALLDRGFATTGVTWTQGDFNYDGTVDAGDYLLVDSTYLQQQGGTPSPTFLSQRESQFGPDYVSQLLISIPEPSSTAGLFLALPFLTRRRRRATR